MKKFLLPLLFSLVPLFGYAQEKKVDSAAVVERVARETVMVAKIPIAEGTQKVNPTTQEEYNYLTKGYKIQIESGLDMKKGYHLSPINFLGKKDSVLGSTVSLFWNNNTIERSITFWGLYRDGESYPCAILCVCYRHDNGYTHYCCLPSTNANSSIWDQFYEDQKSQGQEWQRVWAWAFAKLASYLVSR